MYSGLPDRCNITTTCMLCLFEPSATGSSSISGFFLYLHITYLTWVCRKIEHRTGYVIKNLHPDCRYVVNQCSRMMLYKILAWPQYNILFFALSVLLKIESGSHHLNLKPSTTNDKSPHTLLENLLFTCCILHTFCLYSLATDTTGALSRVYNHLPTTATNHYFIFSCVHLQSFVRRLTLHSVTRLSSCFMVP